MREGGANLTTGDAERCIYGYAVGLDMTRRDLQSEAKKLGRPWCIAKGFDRSAPVGGITPAAWIEDISKVRDHPRCQRPAPPTGQGGRPHLEDSGDHRAAVGGVGAQAR